MNKDLPIGTVRDLESRLYMDAHFMQMYRHNPRGTDTYIRYAIQYYRHMMAWKEYIDFDTHMNLYCKILEGKK